MMPDLEEPIALVPCQSLALRKAIEAMKADDSIYSACPAVVRDALCDFLMPPYSSAEKEIEALLADRESQLRIIDKFASKIHELEAKLARRATVAPSEDVR